MYLREYLNEILIKIFVFTINFIMHEKIFDTFLKHLSRTHKTLLFLCYYFRHVAGVNFLKIM